MNVADPIAQDHQTSDTLSNVDMESELLGSLMNHNEMIDRVADLVRVEDFSAALMGRIYQAIQLEASKGKPANPVTLRGYFEQDDEMKEVGGPTFLVRMTGGATGLMTIDAAKHIADLAQRRKMRDGLKQVVTDCGDLSIPSSDIVTGADAAVSMSARDHVHQPTAGECFDELIDGFDEQQSGVLCHQIPSLDELIGPLRPKQLIIGAARPGMGKTAVALSLAIGAARAGHGVLFVSLEMSSKELAMRMAADMCFGQGDAIPFNAIRDGRLSDQQRRRVVQAGSAIRGWPLHVIDAGHLTTGRLSMLARRHARRMAANGRKLELIIVDYLQLLSPDSRGRSNYEAVSEVSRALKGLAKEQDVAVLALAQLSREVEKRVEKRPQLSDLRDSGQIEQDADIVLFLLRQEYYHRLIEPERMSPEWPEWNDLLEAMRGEIEFICAKRRNGTTGSARGVFHGAYQAVRG